MSQLLVGARQPWGPVNAALSAVFGLENQVADARGQASSNLVRLYKALGGGWDPDEVEEPDPETYEEQPDTRRTLQDEEEAKE